MSHLLQHSRICDQRAERRTAGADPAGDCANEPRELTHPRARAILHAHDRHMSCRQWVAAAAYLSAGLDDE
ncbi:hypothetical protein AB0L57_32680 [Nocardia sp. NPDC052254]|uniref:hypothetical protein n=1 Tax=Nocardia sp. NPDC052254 TaxID=3155681 RepID=UPI00342F32F2